MASDERTEGWTDGHCQTYIRMPFRPPYAGWRGVENAVSNSEQEEVSINCVKMGKTNQSPAIIVCPRDAKRDRLLPFQISSIKWEKHIIEPQHEIFNNVVCATCTSKGSDQPAHTRSLIRAFASA